MLIPYGSRRRAMHLGGVGACRVVWVRVGEGRGGRAQGGVDGEVRDVFAGDGVVVVGLMRLGRVVGGDNSRDGEGDMEEPGGFLSTSTALVVGGSNE